MNDISCVEKARVLRCVEFHKDPAFIQRLKTEVTAGRNTIDDCGHVFGLSVGARSVVCDGKFGMSPGDDHTFHIGIISGRRVSAQSEKELNDFLNENGLFFLDVEDAFILRRLAQPYWGFNSLVVCHRPIQVKEDLACYRLLTIHTDIIPEVGEKIDPNKSIDAVGTIFPRDFFQNLKELKLLVGVKENSPQS